MTVDTALSYINPMGSQGIGGFGILGAAAAVVNAGRQASRVRVRDLPVGRDPLPAGPHLRASDG